MGLTMQCHSYTSSITMTIFNQKQQGVNFFLDIVLHPKLQGETAIISYINLERVAYDTHSIFQGKSKFVAPKLVMTSLSSALRAM